MTPKRPHVPIAERRRQLADAALRVMARDGAWALTTRAVAAEAEVPHGTVHYAFSGGKEELLRAVVEADVDRAADVLDVERLGEGSAEEVLGRVLGSYADSLIAEPAAELVLQELTLMGARERELGAVVEGSTDEYRAMTVRLLEALAARSGLTWDGDVVTIAEQLLGLTFGVSESWLITGDDDRLRAALADAAVMFAARLR